MSYYGGLRWQTETTTTLAANTPAKAAGTTVGVGCYGFQHSNNRLTCMVNEANLYKVDVTASVDKGAGGSTLSKYHIYRNGEATGFTVNRTIASAADDGAFPLSGFVNLRNGDYVELWIESDTGDDLEVKAGAAMLITRANA